MSHALRRSTSSAAAARRQPARRFELLQVVYTRHAVPDRGLRKGQCGTIVELFEGSPKGDAYLVEFADDEGRTLDEVELTAEQLAAAPPSP